MSATGFGQFAVHFRKSGRRWAHLTKTFKLETGITAQQPMATSRVATWWLVSHLGAERNNIRNALSGKVVSCCLAIDFEMQSPQTRSFFSPFPCSFDVSMGPIGKISAMHSHDLHSSNTMIFRFWVLMDTWICTTHMAHSSSSDAPQLSPDIIESIIDFVAQNSARNWNGSLGKDILNCALVSQTFRHRAQFHIFEAVYIRHEPKYRIERLQNLKNLIKTNPDISLSVQELFLECRGLQCAWISEDPTFLNVMESITRNGRPLRKLTLEADKFIDDGYGTMRIPDFQPLLERFFRPFILPFITSLVLDRLENVPIEVITGCSQLVDLELLHVELVEKTSEGAVTFHSRPALKRLAIRLARPMSIWEKALDLSRLDTYEICRDGLPDLRSEQRIIDAAGESLHVLKIYSLNTECKPFIKYGSRF